MERFVDELQIHVSSGHGGHGCVSFRREKYVPKGGPDGGDGGRGGDVIFLVRRNLKTLSHLRMKNSFAGRIGQPGQGRNMHGRDGEPVIIPVPPGTTIRDVSSGEILADLKKEGEELVLFRGGRGGKGNAHFATARHQTPRFAQEGEAGEEADLVVELAIIADVGFVGFPNAGKSSLLKALTNADPRVAAYPFTTKVPNLGVLTIHDRDIVLADIPGIIEGASHGAGLGFQFLRHISRTVGIAVLIDLSEENFQEAFAVLMEEMQHYSLSLEKKRRLVIGTKLDMPDTVENLNRLRESLPDERVIGISSFTRTGIAEVAQEFFDMAVSAVSEEETRDEDDEVVQ